MQYNHKTLQMDVTSQSYAVFFGLAGAASSLIFASAGAAVGTALSCRGIAKAAASSCDSDIKSVQVDETPGNGNTEMSYFVEKSKSESEPIQAKVDMKVMLPIVMSGVIAIYGLIYSIISATATTGAEYSESQGYACFAGGMAVGLCCLVSGIAIGVCGEAGIYTSSRNSKMFVLMTLVLIYCEALGLYGLIFGLISASLSF